jgi:hypothetical protein
MAAPTLTHVFNMHARVPPGIVLGDEISALTVVKGVLPQYEEPPEQRAYR